MGAWEMKMTISWKVSVENRFNAKVDYLNNAVSEIASFDDAKTISREIQNSGALASAIYHEDNGTYTLYWDEK